MKIKSGNTKINWINRHGEPRQHSLGGKFSHTYALDWFRRSILECQGFATLSLDEKRNSKLQLVSIENFN